MATPLRPRRADIAPRAQAGQPPVAHHRYAMRLIEPVFDLRARTLALSLVSNMAAMI